MIRLSTLIYFLLSTILGSSQKLEAFLDINPNVYPDDPIELTPSLFATTNEFELYGGLMVVDGVVDDKKSSFIIDTGASDLIINTSNVIRSNSTAIGLFEEMEAALTRIRSFEVGEFLTQNITAYEMDLSDIEQTVDINLGGLLGASVLQNRSLHLNYAKKEFTIRDAMDKKTMSNSNWKSYSLVQFDHILAVKIKIEGKSFWMGLDTGAEVSLLSDEFKSKVKYSKNSCQKICGLGSAQISLPQISVKTAQIGQLSFNANNFLLSPFGAVQDQLGDQLDGILGFPFFSQFEVMVDYKNQRLYLR